jgi:glycosyltransferase involved in cell wall biosynthesis
MISRAATRPKPTAPVFTGRLYCVSPYANLSGAPRSSLEHAGWMGGDFDSACLILPGRGAIEERARAAGVPVRIWPVENRGFRRRGLRRSFFRDLGAVLGSRWRFFRALCGEFRQSPGLVHVHSSVSVAPLALAAARWCGLPAVLHVREPAGSVLQRAVVCGLAGLAQATVCVSDGIRQGYGRRFARRAAVIYNALPVSEAEAGPDPGRLGAPRIVMPAQMGRRKGFDLFLSIIRRLKEKGAAFEAWMIGDWNAETDRRRALEFIEFHHLETVVSVRSAVAVMAPIYRQTDLLLLPARRDPLPRVVMEAMGYGIPVVASRVDGIPEMVEDGVTGCLVEPEDVDGFVAAVARLLQHPEQRRQMGAAGRERARRLFAPEAYRAAMLELYRPLLPRRPGRDAGGDP